MRLWVVKVSGFSSGGWWVVSRHRSKEEAKAEAEALRRYWPRVRVALAVKGGEV